MGSNLCLLPTKQSSENTSGAAFQAFLLGRGITKTVKGTDSEGERRKGQYEEEYISTKCGFISKWCLLLISLELKH